MQPRFSLIILFLSVLAWTPDAHAYIDPGTGSILIQGLIAAIAAIGVTLKLYWHKFAGLFGRRSKDKQSSEDTEKSEHGVSDKNDRHT